MPTLRTKRNAVKRIFRIIALSFAATATAVSAYAHRNLPQTAIKTLNSAIEIMDDGKPDVAADILKELYRMYPDSYSIPYELALAYMWNGDFDSVVSVVSPLENHPDCLPEVFSLLGSAYDELGDYQKALDTYDRGLTRFPESGHLCVEKGIVWLRKNDVAKALDNFEHGISVDPGYAPNYYRAATIYADSGIPVYGLLYAEAHQFLSDNSDRNTQMAALIRSIYENQITVNGDSINIKLTNRMNKNMESPVNFYEIGIALGVDGVKNGWTLEGVKKMRATALSLIAGMKTAEELNRMYILAYQLRVKEAGHWDAYNIYVLGAAFPEECEEWFKSEANEAAFDRFAEWYRNNPFTLDNDHTVGRLAAELENTSK